MSNTNWTELYDLSTDPWQGANIANSTDLEAFQKGCGQSQTVKSILALERDEL